MDVNSPFPLFDRIKDGTKDELSRMCADEASCTAFEYHAVGEYGYHCKAAPSSNEEGYELCIMKGLFSSQKTPIYTIV